MEYSKFVEIKFTTFEKAKAALKTKEGSGGYMGTIREKAFKMMKRLKDKVGCKRKDVDLDCSAELVKAFGEECMHINYIDSFLYELKYFMIFSR